MVVPGKCLVDSVCFGKSAMNDEEKREEEKQQNTKQGLLLLPAAAAAAALSIASKEVKEKRTSRQRQHEARQRGRE